MRYRQAAAFTLLELLIAIAIFALLGLASYRMLSTVLASDEALRRQEQQLRELVRGMAALERDLAQAGARPVRDGYGEPQAALRGDNEQGMLEFTRLGWRNPTGQPRSQWQRVRWQYRDGQLQRVYWNVLDRAQDSPPQQQVVLPALDGLRLAFLDDNQQWLDSWPTDDSARQRARLPRAVRLVLQHPRYGELERVLRLPDNPAQSPLGNPEEAP